jgi:hypothetical protein
MALLKSLHARVRNGCTVGVPDGALLLLPCTPHPVRSAQALTHSQVIQAGCRGQDTLVMWECNYGIESSTPCILNTTKLLNGSCCNTP